MASKSIIHLSDLHIGRRDAETARTKKIIRTIAGSYPGVPVIITGDLTDSATRGQFRETRRLLDRLAKTNPILAVPGNHDYAWQGIIWREGAWKHWVHYLGSPLGWGVPGVPWMEPDHEPKGIDGLGVWKDGPCVYFGIDSGDPNDKQHTARGFISKRLADALRVSLETYRNKTRIAIVHHHPFTADLFLELVGAKRLMRALKDNCELLLFGHKHKYGIWWGKDTIPLVVSSHKSTNTVEGRHCMYTIIDIQNVGTPNVSFRHRLEVI